jgi:hypothetical protein
MNDFIPLNYTYHKNTILGTETHYFKTEINGFKIERSFTKNSFRPDAKESELGLLMIKAFKTYINTTFRDGLKLVLENKVAPEVKKVEQKKVTGLF